MESPLRPPADPEFRLIETGLWTPDAGLRLADLHLGRLRASAARLEIGIKGLDAALAAVRASGPRRLRLTVDAGGQVEITLHDFTPEPEGRAWRLAVSKTRLLATDPWLSVKSTERDLYDRTRADLPEGVEEVIFLNTDGAVCEGTITNIFVDRGEGLETPSLSSGVSVSSNPSPRPRRSVLPLAKRARRSRAAVSESKSALAEMRLPAWLIMLET